MDELDRAQAAIEAIESAGVSMTREELIKNSLPSEGFAIPPYRAELFSEKSGWSGVMNANGVNCLSFKFKSGAKITDFQTAQEIAEKWNRGNA